MGFKIVNGKYFFGPEGSDKGWAKQIGNFHLLSAEGNFRRYIASVKEGQKFNEFQNIILKLSHIAQDYDLLTSPIYQTYDYFWRNEEFNQIYLIDKKSSKRGLFTGPREEFPAYVRNPSQLDVDPLDTLVILSQRRNYSNTSRTIDINDALKPTHKDLITRIDEILRK